MNYKVREMIKNVIEENAVSFKETTSQVLLNKVGNVLSEKYVEISQQIFTEEAGLFVSNTGKDMGPVNPPTHGGGYTENPNRPNRRPDSTGPSARENRTGGGFYDRPTNRVDGRQTPQSTGENDQYNQNDPFWSSQRGSLFLQNWALLAAALRMPTLDRATLNAINQQGFQTLAAFRAHLQNLANTYAIQYGVVMPPLPL